MLTILTPTLLSHAGKLLIVFLLHLISLPPCQGLKQYRNCPGRTLIANATEGRITILAKEGEKYASLISCEWLIQTTPDRPFISLSVVSFATECSFDFVYLFDGCNGTDRRPLAALSGDLDSLSSRVFVASSGCMQVHFVSDLDYTRRGFAFDFVTGTCPVTCSGGGAGGCNASGACVCPPNLRGDRCEHAVADSCASPSRWEGGRCACAAGRAGFNCSLDLSGGGPPGVWHSLPSLASPRFHAATAVVGDSVYLFGGRDLSRSLDDLLRLRLNSSADGWASVSWSGPGPQPRHGHAMWAAGGALFVHGGAALGGAVLADLWRFSGGAWSRLPLPSSAPALAFHSATPVAGGDVLLVGGRGASGRISGAALRLVVSASGAASLEPLRARAGSAPALMGHSAVWDAARGDLVLFGGFRTAYDGALAVRIAGVHLFSVARRIWSALGGGEGQAGAPQGRAFHAAAVTGDVMVVVGGSVHVRDQQREVCHAGAAGRLLYYHLGCHQWLNESQLRAAERLPVAPTGNLPPGRLGAAAALPRPNLLLLLGGFAGQALDRADAYVLPASVARPEGVSAEQHCASLRTCTADPRCAACVEGGVERCVPLADANASCKTFSCAGVCRLLGSCEDCLAHRAAVADPLRQPCAWCALKGECRQRSTTADWNCTEATPAGWWTKQGLVTDLVTDLGKCRTAAPRAGAHLSCYLPPVNVSLPDETIFLNSFSTRLVELSALSRNATDPCMLHTRVPVDLRMEADVMPVVKRSYLSQDGRQWPFELKLDGSRLSAGLVAELSSDETEANLRTMAVLNATAPSHRRFGLAHPFINGITSFYLLRLRLLRVQVSTDLPRFDLSWLAGDLPRPDLISDLFLRPPRLADKCAALPSCLACAANAACGWCRSASVCQRRDGSEHCVHELEEVVTRVDQCPVCADHLDCRPCALDAACEWHPPKASCVRRGRFNTSVTRYELCPAPCTGLTNCSACMRRQECVWCDTSARCYPFAWQVWNLVGDCSSWRFREACPSPCNGSTCATCLTSRGCAWCHQPGSAHVGSCARWPVASPVAPAGADSDSNTTCPAANATTVMSYFECPPIDECRLGLDSKCKANSTCVDRRHGYECRCDPGFEGDGEKECRRTCDPACVHGRCSGAPNYTCICDLGFTGSNCSTDCGCNRHSTCLSGPGSCDRCLNGTTGAACDRCLLGHHGNASLPAGCAPCSCHGHGVGPQLCDPATGHCRCRHNTQGADCSSCLPDHHGRPTAGEPCFATCTGRRRIANASEGYVGWAGPGAGGVLHCHWLVEAGAGDLILVQFSALRGLPCQRGGVFLHDRAANVSAALAPAVGLVGVACDRLLDGAAFESRSGLLAVYFLHEPAPGTGSGPEFALNFTVLRCPDCGLNRSCLDGRCQCPPGRRGALCQWEDCPSNCSGANGVCRQGACTCAAGWAGADCSRRLDALKGPTVAPVTRESPPRLGHTLVKCGDQLLLFGGETPDGAASDQLFRFLEDELQWRLLPCSATCPPAMSWHAAACEGNASAPAMMVLGSTDGALWRFAVSAGTWSRTALPEPLSGGALGHSLTLSPRGDVVVLIGGFLRPSTAAQWAWNEDVFLLNASGLVRRVASKGQVPAGLFGHTAATGADTGDLLFVIGGFHSSRHAIQSVSLHERKQAEPAVSSDIYAFRLDTGEWFLMSSPRVVGTPPPPHAFASLVQVGHTQVLVHGGVGVDGQPLSDRTLRVYDLYCNVWSEPTVDWLATAPDVRNFSMAYGAALAPSAKRPGRFLLMGGALAGTISRLTFAVEQLSGAGGLSLRCRTCQCAGADARVQDCGAQPSCRHCRATGSVPDLLGVRGRQCVWCGTCEQPACRNGTSCGAACTFSIYGPMHCPAEESCGDAARCRSCATRGSSCRWTQKYGICEFLTTAGSGDASAAPSCADSGCPPAAPCPQCVSAAPPCAFASARERCLPQATLPISCAGGRCGAVFLRQCPNLNNCSSVSVCARCLAVPGCGWVASQPSSLDGQGMCLAGGYGGPQECPPGSEKRGCGLGGPHWAFAQCPPENECENGHHTCDGRVEVCVDKIDGFSCECKPGYERQRGKCQPKCEAGCQHGTCVRPNECRCHFGFVGVSCATECDCNGHSDCRGPGRVERADCLNCTHNTQGKHCERCLPGFVGDPRKGGQCTACSEFCHGHSHVCAMPDEYEKAMTSPVSQLSSGPMPREAMCVSCANSTTGRRCERCREGFFRLSRDLRRPCSVCKCNGHAWRCDASTGTECACRNNTRTPEKCTNRDSVRANPVLLNECHANQCSVCKDYFLGDPKDGRQCYRQMSMDNRYCFDFFDSQAQCGLKPTKPLPPGKALFFVVQPKYMNVDIRVVVDMLQGEVDVYVAADSRRFTVTNDPATWQHLVAVHAGPLPPLRRRRAAASPPPSAAPAWTGPGPGGLRELNASPIITHARLEPGLAVLLVRRVSRRLVLFVSRSEHNLKSRRFYLIFRGAAPAGAEGQVMFRQDQVHIDLFVFFSVFFACFFLLLGAFIVGWKCKQVMDFRRSMERELRQRQTMASRPFARVFVALDTPGAAAAADFSPVPVAVEPTDDGIACVGTLLIQQPGPLLCLGSGLMTMRVMYPSGKQAAAGAACLRRRASQSAC